MLESNNCKIMYGDLLKSPHKTLAVTTNGFVTAKGRAVMGRGIALLLKNKVPDIEYKLGEAINKNGNVINLIHNADENCSYDIISLPVKPDYVIVNEDKSNIVTHARNKYKVGAKAPGFHSVADIAIIKESLSGIMAYADINDIRDISIPRPGCGAGELNWEDIYPMIHRILDNRFSCYTFNTKTQKIFFSGSRDVVTLPIDIEETLIETITRDEEVLVGDCKGADSLIQKWFAERAYSRVTVFHIGNRPRNLYSSLFKVIKISGNKYTDKDDFMISDCDKAIALWNGVSKGTKRNIDTVLSFNKKVLVYTTR